MSNSLNQPETITFLGAFLPPDLKESILQCIQRKVWNINQSVQSGNFFVQITTRLPETNSYGYLVTGSISTKNTTYSVIIIIGRSIWDEKYARILQQGDEMTKASNKSILMGIDKEFYDPAKIIQFETMAS